MARYNTVATTATSSGAATITTPTSGLTTTLTGSAPYTTILPNPVAFQGYTQTFWNSTSGVVTLNTPSGTFVGPGSTGTANQTLPSNGVINVTSNGTDYIITTADDAYFDNIQTLQTSFPLVNTTATTVNFAGAATTLTVGNATGATATIRPGTIVGSNTIQNLWNTVATTVYFAGAGTTIQIGAATGTTTVNHSLTASGSNAAITFSPGGTGGVTLSPAGSGGVTISPSGGTVTMAPSAAGNINNMNIGASTRGTAAFTTLDASGNTIIGASSSNTLTINATATGITQLSTDNSTKLATTAYVQTALSSVGGSYTTITSGTTATTGAYYFANTSAGAFTLTLPATPSVNNQVSVADLAGSFDKYNLTIAANGSLIMGLSQDLIVNVKNASLKLVYSGSTYGWKLV